jgi:hypothetical protein
MASRAVSRVVPRRRISAPQTNVEMALTDPGAPSLACVPKDWLPGYAASRQGYRRARRLLEIAFWLPVHAHLPPPLTEGFDRSGATLRKIMQVVVAWP